MLFPPVQHREKESLSLEMNIELKHCTCRDPLGEAGDSVEAPSSEAPNTAAAHGRQGTQQ